MGGGHPVQRSFTRGRQWRRVLARCGRSGPGPASGIVSSGATTEAPRKDIKARQLILPGHDMAFCRQRRGRSAPAPGVTAGSARPGEMPLALGPVE